MNAETEQKTDLENDRATKICRYCANEINQQAKVCHYCGRHQNILVQHFRAEWLGIFVSIG
ncbi:MAG: hypothetical protein R3240_09895, partial [Gammaproteobacteria bacterium]|nr:hypothetical protein [Gammaproteobacteria bacterium]